MLHTVLYIHGMSGGLTSRIPSILSQSLVSQGIDVVVRTYDFNPEIAAVQIASWVEELKPSLVIGESLGALQAMRIGGVPHIYVSPALNAPLFLGLLAPLCFVPGMRRLLNRVYRPKYEGRQVPDFTWRNLRPYLKHHRIALEAAAGDSHFAFFGNSDHYRRSGVVSVRSWDRHFGEGSRAMYAGTHFMEEEYIHSMLIPKIMEILDL